MSRKTEKTVSLVLGSGGARGLAHIGVIHWLEENGFKIESISGCSMGALIGGVYAAGKLDAFEEWVNAITKVDIVTLIDLSWESTGLVKGDKIIDTLIDLVGDQLIEDLPFSYTAIASDVHREKEIWITSGKLFDAIRASISLPLRRVAGYCRLSPIETIPPSCCADHGHRHVDLSSKPGHDYLGV